MAKASIQLLVEEIEPRIVVVRGVKVMLDADLAELYGTATKRNRHRFPEDFLFQFTTEETERLRSQNATSNSGRGGRRYRPYAFTEHGALMAASVLNTPKAIAVSVFVVRAFVRLREVAAAHKELAHKLAELERKVDAHDHSIRSLVAAIRELLAPPIEKQRGRIGFGRENENR